MADQRISETEKKDFKKAFDLYDVNKDGHITTKELSTVLKKLGQNPSDQEVADFVKACDTDKNGTIEFNEFCRYLVDFRRKMFDDIDKDRSGYITPDEVQAMFKSLGVEISVAEAKSIVDEADTDKDGKMSYEEFVKTLHCRPLI